ncbi:MAG: pseudouridine synthase [Patescibacteria group bacterium]|nr:pseudouridine synthase [Patescibacteria group bacterium]
MRINKYIAQSTSLSRRAADTAIADGRVQLNGQTPDAGSQVSSGDIVTIDGRPINPDAQSRTVLINKPAGFVCSRNGQGSRTIYELLPERYRSLNSVGRLDKESSGLLVLTNNGELANTLTHPSYQKVKLYLVTLDKPLEPLHQQFIADKGIQLADGESKFGLQKIEDDATRWRVTMFEGRNRQIRRTFEALGYSVTALHRTQFGEYVLGDIAPAQIVEI